ncbi:hypothetical protein RclHR1_07090002 [Rhizophagus clarus]|uniref:Uncharacterized protein n=1 Tax=Rhizophagus clarus TaxID=94130 RepID=A0A2Z6S1D0_9GLOM|nr:hypothetical protein RclHR1_07090002 [Rhizophagus clarus]GES81578.1 hypothetical protein RCL_jg1497.t1 [Rhizophagus clarus]
MDVSKPKPNFTDSYDFSNTSYNLSSNASFTIRNRRNKRRLRHETTINTYMLDRIRRLPTQHTRNPSTNRFFNGGTFR